MENTSSQQLLPEELWFKLSRGEQCQIVDVREPSDYRSERIAGSLLIPLADLEKKVGKINRKKPIYLLCHTGILAHRAATLLSEMGLDRTRVVQGGLQAWYAAGYPLERDSRAIWSLERQVRLTAGVLILVGIALSVAVNSNLICLSVFVALTMIFSAVTNSCGMATLLMRMPWNRGSGT